MERMQDILKEARENGNMIPEETLRERLGDLSLDETQMEQVRAFLAAGGVGVGEALSTEDALKVLAEAKTIWANQAFDEEYAEYIVKDVGGNVIGTDKCRLLRPYIVAIGDSLTYGLMRYDHKYQTPTWHPWTNGYPTAEIWEDTTRIHIDYADRSHRLLPAYQGYRGYLSMRLTGFSWLGNATNGHGPFHKGYPGATIGQMFATDQLGNEVLNQSPSYTFVIYLGGMNDCSGRDITGSQTTLNTWSAGVNIIKSQRVGKGRTLLLALQVPPLSEEFKLYWPNNADLRYQTAQNNIAFLNERIGDYVENGVGFIGTNITIATDHEMDDGMHFSSNGYERISSMIFEALEASLW